MNRQADTDFPVHELIANRWSPCGFASRQVSREEICSLFEAARWSASSYNEQPWSYIVATQDDAAEFEKVLSCLVDGNQAWAKDRKSTRLNSSHVVISYAVFCLKKKKKHNHKQQP